MLDILTNVGRPLALGSGLALTLTPLVAFFMQRDFSGEVLAGDIGSFVGSCFCCFNDVNRRMLRSLWRGDLGDATLNWFWCTVTTPKLPLFSSLLLYVLMRLIAIVVVCLWVIGFPKLRFRRVVIVFFVSATLSQQQWGTSEKVGSCFGLTKNSNILHGLLNDAVPTYWQWQDYRGILGESCGKKSSRVDSYALCNHRKTNILLRWRNLPKCLSWSVTLLVRQRCIPGKS